MSKKKAFSHYANGRQKITFDNGNTISWFPANGYIIAITLNDTDTRSVSADSFADILQSVSRITCVITHFAAIL